MKRTKRKQTAIIIGAGPAGLTAALELLKRTGIRPIVFEATPHIGGISKTIKYKGNRMDIGGHRFFSKSDRVMDWWLQILPLQGNPSKDDRILQRNVPLSTAADAPDPEKTDRVMLVRSRLSRILFRRRFFDYPVSLNWATLSGLGFVSVIRIGLSYCRAALFPLRREHSLEDLFVNRFGRELYRTFFRDYTEKVWGVPCSRIKADWGAQRIKGLSIGKAVLHSVRRMFRRRESIRQRSTETSLIEQFLYPKHGPGQMWETVAAMIRARGGEIHPKHSVVGIHCDGDRVSAVTVRDETSKRRRTVRGDHFFSSMPIRDLVRAMDAAVVPKNVREVADGLVYRDFMTMGLLVRKLKVRNQTSIRTMNNIVPDTWIYVQESDVKLGRLQIFNNWSPYLVKDPSTVWIGLEYFCNEGDELWCMRDEDFARFAIDELVKIDFIARNDVLDYTLARVPKAYPAYFGSYDRFHVLREHLDRLENLFLIGRNGMHRYNNQDHSMLSAMTAVDNLANGVTDKEDIWSVNAEQEYHEEKT